MNCVIQVTRYGDFGILQTHAVLLYEAGADPARLAERFAELEGITDKLQVDNGHISFVGLPENTLRDIHERFTKFLMKNGFKNLTRYATTVGFSD